MSEIKEKNTNTFNKGLFVWGSIRIICLYLLLVSEISIYNNFFAPNITIDTSVIEMIKANWLALITAPIIVLFYRFTLKSINIKLDDEYHYYSHDYEAKKNENKIKKKFVYIIFIITHLVSIFLIYKNNSYLINLILHRREITYASTADYFFIPTLNALNSMLMFAFATINFSAIESDNNYSHVTLVTKVLNISAQIVTIPSLVFLMIYGIIYLGYVIITCLESII